jgi:hypothetical protein
MRRARLPLQGSALRPGAGAVGTCGWERDGRARDSESRVKKERSEGCARGPASSCERFRLFLPKAAFFFEEALALRAGSRVVLRRDPGSSCKRGAFFFEEVSALLTITRVPPSKRPSARLARGRNSPRRRSRFPLQEVGLPLFHPSLLFHTSPFTHYPLQCAAVQT